MRTFKRAAVFLLALLVLAVSVPFAEAATGTYVKNSGTRHVVCTALSSQANAYYTGSNTFDSVSALSASASDPMNSAMFQKLHTLMQTTMTRTVSYSSLTSYWPYTDANNKSSNPVLFYSDELSSSFNREHVWPKSRASFKESYGGSDLHHLRPTNTQVNSTRSNFTFGNVKGVLSSFQTYAYGGKTVLWYSSSADRVEVNDNIKGDVARILLYVWCRWEEPNLYDNASNPVVGPGDDKNDGKKVIESLDTLLQWMKIDPVDTWEMSRNDQCENVQGNRNVFIDYPEYAWLLFGRTVPEDYTTPSKGFVPTFSPTPSAATTPTPTVTPKPTATPTPTATPKPTATPTPKPTAAPTQTARPTPIELPDEGDYVLRIDGGFVGGHTAQVNGEDCLKVDLFIDGVTEERLLASLSYVTLAYDADQLQYVQSSSNVTVDEAGSPGLIRYTFVSVNGLMIDSDTPLLSLYFRLSDDLKDGDTIAFAFCREISASSINRTNYRTEKRTVGVDLNPYLCGSALYGDANCDGSVDASDASLVLRSLVGLSKLFGAGLYNARVSGEGALHAEDAALILRHTVLLIDRFPIEE